MSKAADQLKGKIPGESTGITIKKSICTICDPLTQCGLNLYIKENKLIKVEGSKENPKNEGTLCSKGAATRQYVYSPDRLKTPLKRTGPKGSDEFVPISWDEALDTIAKKLNEYKDQFGPESVAFYCGYTKWLRPFLHRLTHSFGSPNYLTESSTCAQATYMAQKLNFGTATGPDIKNTNCLLVWSANPFHSNTTLARKVLAAKDRGMKIIAVDPRCTPMTAQADIHLQLKPGTDGALALTMANVIINEKLFNQDFINNYTFGFEEFAQYIQEFTPEKGESITGVKAETIKQAARLYANTKPAAIMQSAAPVVHNTNGVQNYRAIFALIALTGNYDISGGNFVDPPSFIGVSGGIPTRESEFVHSKKFEEMPPRVGQEKFPVWTELVDQAQAMDLPQQINSGSPYPIKAMLAFGINHRMWPNSKYMLEAIQKLDFFVDVDLFMTDTAKYADLILPACSSVERSELRCYQERYIIYTQPAIQPLFESRSDADIIFDLGRRLKLDDNLIDGGYEAALDYILEPSGITIAELKQHPAGMPVPNPLKIPEKKYISKGFPTPSGKMEFKSLVLEKYANDYGYDSLPVYHPPKNSAESNPELAKEYPLILNTGSRLPMFIHSRTFRMPWTHSLRPEAMADLNPIDAQRLKIIQGDPIKISTPQGEISVKANLSELAQPGVVHMYHAYPDADVNTLFDSDYLDPISGFPGFKALLCKVEKVESN